MQYPKLRELKEAIRALIKGPYTSAFPHQPHKPFERFRGRPYYYKDDCMGCTACVSVCPSGALSFADKKENGSAVRCLTYTMDVCIFCGQCQANCPTAKGIMLSNDFDLATCGKRQDLTQSIDKELILCSSCNEIIAPRDQLIWVAKKLGPLVFSNASLMLYYVRNLDLSVKEAVPTEEKGGLIRADRIKVLCPRCRREAVLKS